MKMTFADAVKAGLKNFSNFKGTATRTEFWYFYLFTVLLNMVLTTLDSIVAPGTVASNLSGAGPIYTLVNIALVLPNLSIGVRRFHDAGFSAKWLLLWLLPIAALFAGGAAAVALNPSFDVEAASEAQMLQIALPFIPGFLLAAGVGIFQLVVFLKASKPAESGNKYAQEAPTSASE